MRMNGEVNHDEIVAVSEFDRIKNMGKKERRPNRFLANSPINWRKDSNMGRKFRNCFIRNWCCDGGTRA